MKRVVLAVAVAGFLSGCIPSLQYRLGQGYYSEKFAKTQVQAAANAGKVKNLGKFSMDIGGCGIFSQTAADSIVVVPAVQSQLQRLGANAADNILANESGADFLLGLLILPSVMGCSNWTVSGEALLVDEGLLAVK